MLRRAVTLFPAVSSTKESNETLVRTVVTTGMGRIKMNDKTQQRIENVNLPGFRRKEKPVKEEKVL